MNAEIQKQWVAALRSDEFNQAQYALKIDDCYCCLGVLCELHRRATGGQWDRNDYLGAHSVLPAEVRIWAGLDRHDPMDSDGCCLTHRNDRMEDFLTIADVIEQKGVS